MQGRLMAGFTDGFGEQSSLDWGSCMTIRTSRDSCACRVTPSQIYLRVGSFCADWMKMAHIGRMIPPQWRSSLGRALHANKRWSLAAASCAAHRRALLPWRPPFSHACSSAARLARSLLLCCVQGSSLRGGRRANCGKAERNKHVGPTHFALEAIIVPV